MSQVIDLCEDSDSDDNGEWTNTNTNTASVPSLPLSRKRARDMEKASNDGHLRNEKDHGHKTTRGSAELAVDLELMDEVEVVSPHKKRRGVMNGERSVKNDAVGNCAQLMKGDHVTKNNVGSEDSEQTSRDDGSANKHSQKLSTSKPPSNASGQQWRVSAWEDRMIELAAYREIHGHCNVPRNCSENSKLADWVSNQRTNYKLHIEGKASVLTLSRIQELESMGFEWGVYYVTAAWEDRLSQLADYRKINGHCNVPRSYSENSKLAQWVKQQRTNYRLHLEGKASCLTLSRIQELESLGFEWGFYYVTAAWEDRLSQLAAYRKINGHCNVPRSYSENSKLAQWVKQQRTNYRLHRQAKASCLTLSRIQELESLGFEWDCSGPAWEDRLSELADYRKIHGHCNVPYKYSENTKLAFWVSKQRRKYGWHLKGKPSSMNAFRIQELESLGFEWDCSGAAWEGRLNELADYRKVHGHCNVPRNYSENAKLGNWVSNQRRDYKLHREGKPWAMTHSRIQELESMGFEWDCSGPAWEDRLSELANYRKINGHCNVPRSYSENSKLAQWVATQRKQYRLHLEGKAPSMTLSRIQALESLGFEWKKGTSKKPSPVDDAFRVRERRAVEPPRLSGPADQNSLSHADLLVAGPPENDCLVAANKPANSRQAGSQLETAVSNENLRLNPVAAEPRQHRHNAFTHALLLGEGSTGNDVQAPPGKAASAPPGIQQTPTPQDEVFQSDDILNKVEMELIWLGEESMYCLVCPEFQFDYIYESASPVLKVELRKISRDDQSEMGKLKQIVRMDNWRVSRHFDFTRKDIRMNYF
jgi:uncharacterized protein YerC